MSGHGALVHKDAHGWKAQVGRGTVLMTGRSIEEHQAEDELPVALERARKSLELRRTVATHAFPRERSCCR
jgi:hypothetical protein